MMIFIKRIYGNMILSSNILKRWSFQRGLRWDMIFLVLSGKMVFFFPKIWYFFLGQKERDDLFQEIHGNMIHSVDTYGCYKHGATPFCQKKKKKIKDKLIEVLDWHPRKSSTNSLYFHGDLYRSFTYCSPAKKNSKT